MLRNNSYRISIKPIYPLLLIAVLSFIPSAYLQTFKIGSLFYDAVRYIECPLILFIFLRKSNRLNRNRLFWYVLLLLFYLNLVVVTFIYGRTANAIVAVRNMAFSICFIMIIDYYCEKNLEKAITSLRVGFEILFWFNFLTVVMFPKGLYLVSNDANPGFVNMGFFLGHENNSIEIFIPLIGLLMLESYLKTKELGRHTLIVIICSLITVVISWSANAIVCLVFFLVFYIAFKLPFSKLFNIQNFMAASIGITLLLAVFRLEYLFPWFITTVLKKSMTLSKRTFIWSKSIAYIRSNWLIGYGIESTYEKVVKIGAINSCHNYYLDIMYYGGVVLMIIFAVMLLYLINKIKMFHDEKITLICSTIIGVYSILWIATPIHRGTICIMFAMWFIMTKIQRMHAQ